MHQKHDNKPEKIMDDQEEVVVIEFINRERHIINFVKDKTMFGFFKYGVQLKNPQIGDLLRVRFDKINENNYFKVLSVQPAKTGDTCDAMMHFKGPVKIAPKSGFGFVEEIFIYPKMVTQFKLIDGQNIEGKALLSYNKKKDSWGWIGYKIETVNH